MSKKMILLFLIYSTLISFTFVQCEDDDTFFNDVVVDQFNDVDQSAFMQDVTMEFLRYFCVSRYNNDVTLSCRKAANYLWAKNCSMGNDYACYMMKIVQKAYLPSYDTPGDQMPEFCRQLLSEKPEFCRQLLSKKNGVNELYYYDQVYQAILAREFSKRI
ncbi:hypothetical protein KC460_03955 [Candidatus Dependentiae bacterium]|nr:hypothetical protein [Candidatus Dependentiae bacterium]